MTAAIARRGPDDHGGWQDPDLPLYLGHRRLAILDLSPEGRQPMVSESGRYVIVFNGEIYNFREIAEGLTADGARFRGRSDTEVMLAAFERRGVNETLQKLCGMFAFALWDRQDGMLHFARDRMGKKPLYIGWSGDGMLVFGSELKALRACPGYAPAIDRGALCLYMRYGCVPAPFSIYSGTWQMPPGCRLSLSLRDLRAGDTLCARFEPYWSLADVVTDSLARPLPPGDEDAATDRFEALLAESVRMRMISDVPIGAFLSGGVDSSLVTALMQREAGRPVKTFCVGFAERGYDESAHAAAVARHLGTEHHELRLSPSDALAVVPQLPEIHDEPFADVSEIPSFIVSRFAREAVTVALTGDGGDELCGGYLRHYKVPAFYERVRHVPLPLRRLAASGITCVGAARWDRIVPGHPQFGERLCKAAELLPLRGPDEVYRRLVSRFDDPAALVRGGTEPPIPLTDSAALPEGLSFTQRMIYGDTLSYLPNDVLAKMDRAGMAVGLETRAPLLDHRLFAFVWTLPPRMLTDGGQGKILLRRLLARHVPESLTERPKQGFAVPVGAWLRGPLREWAESLLDEKRLAEAGLIDPAPVRRIWQEHLQGTGRHADRLWTVLMFQNWLRFFRTG